MVGSLLVVVVVEASSGVLLSLRAEKRGFNVRETHDFSYLSRLIVR